MNRWALAAASAAQRTRELFEVIHSDSGREGTPGAGVRVKGATVLNRLVACSNRIIIRLRDTVGTYHTVAKGFSVDSLRTIGGNAGPIKGSPLCRAQLCLIRLGPPAEGPWLPDGVAEREAVQHQLDRILGHPLFKHSKRYPNLFRYVVEHTLSGGGHLKERTLGVEVFGRDPGYDTNEDPVVRVTAGEIRKRIAQYYHEGGHEFELRIDLPPGSYAPEFHLPAERSATEVNLVVNPPVPRPSTPTSVLPVRRLTLVYSLLATIVLAVLAAVAWVRPSAEDRLLNDFWGPVLASSGSALICVGEPNSLRPSLPQVEEPTIADYIYGADQIAFSDAVALFHLAELLGSRGKASRIQAASRTTLTDLRQGPVVLVSGFDNEWTIRIAQSLRYRFGTTPDHRIAWIDDSANSSHRDWAVNFSERYSQLTQDYAMVARFSDPTSGQPVVIAAGLGENGTIAAGEFLTDPRQMEAATKHAPSDWRRKNIEVVIATQVIDGKSGPPRVLAAYFW